MTHSLYHSSLYHSSVAPFPAMSRPPVVRRAHTSRATATTADGPNYLARRLAVSAIVLLTLGIIVAGFVLLAGLGGRPASASQAEPAISSSSAVHVASAGDTLWSIARAHHGDVGLDRYVDTLIDLNGGTALQIGQAVRLP